MAGEGSTPIAELIDNGDLVINDGYRAKNSELSTEGLRFARAQNINNGFRFEDADRFPEKDLQKVGIKISQPGDVVFTSKGTVGRFAFVREGTPRFVYAPQLCFWRSLNRKRIHPRWLYYWMQSREFFVQYSGVADQTDMAEYVSLRDQRQMHITLLPIQEQQAIACVLGTLDDKIELNRRMNATLEAMARAIFKSWFVDFDPVREKAQRKDAKAQRRKERQEQDSFASWHPGDLALNPTIADLFPDDFEESELGEIPKGWGVDTILTVSELLSGGTPSTKVPEYWDGGIKWVSARDVSGAHGAFLLNTERTITQEGVDNSSTKILPELTTIVTARGTVGSYCILAEPMAMNQTNYGLKATMEDADYFVFFALGSLVHQLKQRAYGTIFDTITTRTFKTSQVAIPPVSLMSKFDQIVQPTMEAIRQNLKQSRTLAALRDALLPKLISGELRVPDAERIVGSWGTAGLDSAMAVNGPAVPQPPDIVGSRP
jgi:type I restriction enzyme S subunit